MDVYLLKFLVIRCREDENIFIAYKFDYERESFIIIEIFILLKAAYVLAGLLADNFIFLVPLNRIVLFVRKHFNFSDLFRARY